LQLVGFQISMNKETTHLWQAASGADVRIRAGAHFEGIMPAQTADKLRIGASMIGRACPQHHEFIF